jgi:hypothetical protein
MDISERIEKLNVKFGKTTKKEIEFFGSLIEEIDTFRAIHDASKFLKDLGYNVGIMAGGEPIGISKEYTYISKWRNMDSLDYPQLDGYIISNDMRNGNAIVVIWEETNNENN